jgi:hypothetical protein
VADARRFGKTINQEIGDHGLVLKSQECASDMLGRAPTTTAL